MQTLRPAAQYVRLSDDRHQTGDNVADQLTKGQALAEAMGCTVVRIYNDNDRPASAGTKPRPAFEQMLEDAQFGLFEVLVIRTTDRLFRTPKDLQRIVDVFGSKGIVIHQEWSGNPLDMSTPQGVLNAGLMAQVSHYETEIKRKRQKAMNLRRASKGQVPNGGPVPYGYQADRRTLDEARAEVIRESYRALLAGASLGSVMRDLNEREIPAARGGRWTYSNLRGVLLRPLNAGLVQYDGAILPNVTGDWEAVVSVEDYYAIRALLNDPARRTTDGNVRKHLLAGIAQCANCQRPLKSGWVGNRRGKASKSLLYRCTNPECKARVNVARDPLEAEVERRLLHERGHLAVVVVKPQEDVGARLAEIENRIQGTLAQMGADEADVPALAARLAELKAERARIQTHPRAPVYGFRTVAEEWTEAQTLQARQEILLGHLDALLISSRGKTSHRFDPERVSLTWTEHEGAQVPGAEYRVVSRIDGVPLGEGEVRGLHINRR